MAEPGARTLTLWQATLVGVGAIVGGGILAMAGLAFSVTGPSAILAFGVNGLIAILTALSFGELASRFPVSGGAYSYAKRILGVRAAFAVGWILWFAYIVAGVLYALGFAVFAELLLARFLTIPPWLAGRRLTMTLALLATAVYTAQLSRKAGGGGHGATLGKLIVFAVIIGAGGVAALGGGASGAPVSFLAAGPLGLVKAMGLTFIALQGFDAIATVAGEVKEPARTLPRAMLASLGVALLVYLPLLAVVNAVGVPPGQTVVGLATAHPETMIALAAEQFMGWSGWWLVVVAAILSMLSALQANLLAASRVAAGMAGDRTLPRGLGLLHPERKTPTRALWTTALALSAILLMVPDVGSAGGAAGLIFLISFALTHGLAFRARQRAGASQRAGVSQAGASQAGVSQGSASQGTAAEAAVFRTPLFPLVPLLGGLACVALALYQAVVQPSSGMVTLVWLGLGGLLYSGAFADRAAAVDAREEAQDPELLRMRGRSPLVLVPVANPGTARAMAEVGSALAAPEVGQVMLLSVVWEGSQEALEKGLERSVSVQQRAVVASLGTGRRPSALLTFGADPWGAIERVAKTHNCESLLLGLSDLKRPEKATRLEQLVSAVSADVVVLRAGDGFALDRVRRVLVATGGRSVHDNLRARLLGSLCRGNGREGCGAREVVFVRVMGDDASPAQERDALRRLRHLAEDEAPGAGDAELLRGSDVVGALSARAAEADLLILGIQRVGRSRRVFGALTLELVRRVPCAVMLISAAG